MQAHATLKIKRHQNTMTGDRKILGLFSELKTIEMTAIWSLLTNTSTQTCSEEYF